MQLSVYFLVIMKLMITYNWIWFTLFLSSIVASIAADVSTEVTSHDINFVKRSSGSAPPTTPCTKSNEGSIQLDSTLHDSIWICKSHEWVPYQIEPALGRVKSHSADSCKHVREVLATNCNDPPTSGLYWVQDMQVYCDMTTDGGGWTLVWKHSYMETLPLSTNMYYFSKYHKSCTTHDSGWCNVPNKRQFNPTEQMIVAYRSGAIVYAYKGIFNYNIDHDWTGGVLVDFQKIVDTCTYRGSPNVQPAPSANGGDRKLLGLAFDKRSPYAYEINCDTISGNFNSPDDCRWHDCTLDNRLRRTQQTLAIYVR